MSSLQFEEHHQLQFKSWRLFKAMVKEWSNKNKKDIHHQISNLENQLNILDQSGSTSSKKLEIFEELQRTYDARDSILRQKARIKWDTKGNTNSKFYHQYIQYKRCRTQIYGIWEGNKWISRPKEIKHHFTQFFKNLLNQEEGILNFHLDGLNLNCLSSEESFSLINPFTQRELDKSMSNLGANKAPGPDGLNGTFIKFA